MTSDIANAFKKLETQPVVTNNDLDSDFTQENPVDTSKSLSQNQPSTMKQSMQKNLTMYLVLFVVTIVAGVGTGYGGYKLQAQSSSPVNRQSGADIQQVAGPTISVGDVFGINDTNTFGDSAQGYLEAGGLNGEGSHRLLRPGGESQTVYLTSSITDLNPLVGMEVKVYGETFKGQKAGWLMDVGRVEVVKTKGTKPITE
jgi:hypothetical protein